MGTRTKTTSLEDDIAQEEALLTDQECERHAQRRGLQR